MARIFLLIILLLTTCSNKESTDSDIYNQVQTEQTSSEQINKVGSNAEFPRDEGGVFSIIVSLILWSAIILIVVVLAVVIYIKRKQYRKRISHKDETIKTLEKTIRTLKSRYQSLEEDLQNEKRKKREFEEVISQFKANSRNFGNNINEVNDIEVEGKRTGSEVEEGSIEDELFFTVPNGYGKFKHANGISSFEEKRLYKITYQREESEGVIEFVSSKYDGVAINLKDSMIKPACNIIKENENNPNSVSQISPGKVKRVGDDWIIENKIKVEIK